MVFRQPTSSSLKQSKQFTVGEWVRGISPISVGFNPHIPLATRPDGGPVWSCGENYHFLAKDWVKGF